MYKILDTIGKSCSNVKSIVRNVADNIFELFATPSFGLVDDMRKKLNQTHFKTGKELRKSLNQLIDDSKAKDFDIEVKDEKEGKIYERFANKFLKRLSHSIVGLDEAPEALISDALQNPQAMIVAQDVINSGI